ncbi:lysine--tRNA ligase [Candidatus Micrarchaeota archaeon CG10_big_fil_rev_8_21_14_0_10_45_29]|nr:MAG: lysine--tRNA ligase [Candidatus Micrarchaeota archaeon CG10_big_fil_rev_8_21_14_0_10_45_29]
MDEERLSKLENLQKKGINPYPYSYPYTLYSSQIISDYSKLEGSAQKVAGRIVQKRDFGKLAFCRLQDNGGQIQIMARADILGEEMKFFASLDLGDIIGVEGEVCKTKKGEISINAKKITLLSKSLRPLPDKFKGLLDTELRYRKRHLDLIANKNVREFFITRTKIIDAMRSFLNSRGYLEVDTPILQKVYGGAAAKPFTTTHNALDEKLYLRISNELYLKRLIIGGMDKVYEFSKDFRNEAIDSTHNPEFTQIEFYEAYKDYNDFMKLTQEMFLHILNSIGKNPSFECQGKQVDFSKFSTISLYDEIKKHSKIDILSWNDEHEAYAQCEKAGAKPSSRTFAKCVDALFDKFVAPSLFNPTFVIDFPYYMCPLTKKKRDNPALAERFELFIAGFECGNCYSEMTNPLEQRKKLEEQAKALAAGDEESNPIDEEFLQAMEYGMPPTAGMGIGIDRIAMILTDNVSIKEVILFPTVREKSE